MRFKRWYEINQKPPLGSTLDLDHPLSQGLVGFWLLNEGGGGKIYSQGSFKARAILVNNPEWGTNVLDFDGSTQYAQVGSKSGLEGATECTIICNILFKSLVVNASYIRKWRAGSQAFSCTLCADPSNFRLFVNDDSGSNILEADTNDTPLVVSEWYWLAHRWNGDNTIDLFVNGRQRSIVYPYANSPSSIAEVSEYLSFAARYNDGSPDNYCNCKLSSVLFYNRALSDSEIFRFCDEPYSNVLVPQYWYMVDFGAAGGQTASLTDSLILSETLSVLASYKATLTDTFATSDASQTLAHLIASISDTTSMTDARAALAHLKASTADTASFSDQLQVTASYKASISDTISITDSFKVILAALATLADTLSLTDTLTYPAGQTASLTDTFSLTDSQTAVAALKAAIIDTLTLSDTQTALASLKALLTDALSLSDELSTQLIGHIEDTLALSDSTTAIASFLATLIDTFVGADTLEGTLHLQVTLSDTITLGEKIQALAHYALALADTLNLTDSITGIKVEATGIVTITFGTKFPGISISSKQPSATLTGKGPSEDIT